MIFKIFEKNDDVIHVYTYDSLKEFFKEFIIKFLIMLNRVFKTHECYSELFVFSMTYYFNLIFMTLMYKSLIKAVNDVER